MAAVSGRSRKLSFGQLFIYAFLVFFVCFYGLPLVWLFIASTKSQASLLTDPPFLLGTWANLKQSWTNLASYNSFQLTTWVMNSVIYAVGGVALSLIASVPAGYALAVTDFPGRKFILILTLVAIITPSSALVLPIFIELKLLGLNNSYSGMILASGFFPFGVYLAYIYFSSSLPKGILDAARVDGCNSFQIFTRIALPLSQPVIALIAFFSFLAIWGNYFLAFVVLSDDRLYNLPVGLTTLIGSSGALSNLPANDVPIKKPEVILAAILVILPVAVLFLFAQRFVRSGTLSGAEKG